MPDNYDDIALTAAINVLRDSIESGKMPSGLPLAADAADLHAQAADHLETRRRQLGGATLSADPSGEGRDVQVTAFLSPAEAWNLAQFFKRAGFSDSRYGMRDSADRVRKALSEAGFAPR